MNNNNKKVTIKKINDMNKTLLLDASKIVVHKST